MTHAKSEEMTEDKVIMGQLAVKCNNGTFIGKQTDELIIFKGIPYATQPAGKLRWKKAPLARARLYISHSEND